MRCPFCGHDDSQVKDSRPSEDNSAIRRRRHCPECGGRFTTFERVQLRELIVSRKMAAADPSTATSWNAPSITPAQAPGGASGDRTITGIVRA
jgi:transcriptional repressor NrdR